jgi:hypothetical protein
MLGRAAVRFSTAVDKPAIGLLVAVASVTAATGARALLQGSAGEAPYFSTVFPAVMVAALIGGLAPGMAALILSVIVAAMKRLAPGQDRMSA